MNITVLLRTAGLDNIIFVPHSKNVGKKTPICHRYFRGAHLPRTQRIDVFGGTIATATKTDVVGFSPHVVTGVSPCVMTTPRWGRVHACKGGLVSVDAAGAAPTGAAPAGAAPAGAAPAAAEISCNRSACCSTSCGSISLDSSSCRGAVLLPACIQSDIMWYQTESDPI